jgi:CBS domain-containing protein
MQPPVTTIEQNDHVAAAAYVMKRANASALIVTQAQTGQPIGIITDADVSRAVADGMGNWDGFVRTGGRDVGTRLPMAPGVEAADRVMAVGRAVSGSHAV